MENQSDSDDDSFAPKDRERRHHLAKRDVARREAVAKKITRADRKKRKIAMEKADALRLARKVMVTPIAPAVTHKVHMYLYNIQPLRA